MGLMLLSSLKKSNLSVDFGVVRSLIDLHKIEKIYRGLFYVSKTYTDIRLEGNCQENTQ